MELVQMEAFSGKTNTHDHRDNWKNIPAQCSNQEQLPNVSIFYYIWDSFP